MSTIFRSFTPVQLTQSRLIIFIILISYSLYGFSQEDLFSEGVNFVPPSPIASAMTKYGNIPVNLSVGVANVSIPVLTYKTKEVDFPITLSYVTEALKVDQKESSVGLGWNLNFGGVITRTVRGQVDENSLNNGLPNMFSGETNFDKLQNRLYLENVLNGVIDSELDLYNYNFNGNSGSFIVGRDSGILLMPKKKYIIKKYVKNQILSEFEIIDDKGTIYRFGGSYVEKSSTSVGGGVNCNRSYDSPTITAWYLYEVETATGELVNLTYTFDHETYHSGVTQSLTRFDSKPSNSACDEDVDNRESDCLVTYESDVLRISTISSPNYGSVSFNWNGGLVKEIKLFGDGIVRKYFQFDYQEVVPNQRYASEKSPENESRFFLNKLKELNPKSPYAQVQVHKFDYINLANLPPRLSYAQDKLGYFNGIDNNITLLPSTDHYLFSDIDSDREYRFEHAQNGLLKQITYPTGGSTLFEYEANTTMVEKTNPPRRNSYDFKVRVEGSETSKNGTGTHNLPVEQTLNIRLEVTRLGTGSSSTIRPVKFIIKDKNDNVVIQEESGELQPGASNSWSVSKSVYFDPGNLSVFIDVIGDNIEGRVSYWYDIEKPQKTWVPVEVGGGRLASMTDRKSINDPGVTKEYSYSNLTYLDVPQYISVVNRKGMCDIDATLWATKFAKLSSSSLNSLHNYNGSPHAYRKVTIDYLPDGGSETISYNVVKNGASKLVFGDDQINTPRSNSGWLNGKEYKRTIRANNGNTVKTIDYEYYTDSEVDFWSNYVVSTQTSSVYQKTVSYNCTAEDIAVSVRSYQCTNTSHVHEYLVSNSDYKKCVSPGASNVPVYYNNLCDGRSPGDEIQFQGTNHTLINVNEYRYYSFWERPLSVTERFYDGSEKVLETKYDYDNPSHLQATKITKGWNETDFEEIYNLYPEDLSNEISNLSELVANNIVKPVKQFTVRNGEIVKGKVNYYTDEGQIKSVYKSDSYKNYTVQDELDRLDNNNYRNLLDVQYKGGLPFKYTSLNGENKILIWSLDGTRLGATIENLSQSNFTNFNDPVSYSSEIPAAYITNLKATYPDAFITVYKYDVINGITKVTDSNNRDVNYYYDDLGRLSQIKDHEGNILKQYEYNYANQ